MKTLKVALVVPNNGIRGKHGNHRKAMLKKHCHAGKIDLVVYPEAFFLEVPIDEAVDVVMESALDLGRPVLAGVYTGEFETAAYANPSPRSGETDTHLYVKHSTAPQLAFQRPGYRGRSDPMFKPISLGGHRFGAMVCHDMYYGLLPDIYAERGATALFDLTGGNVRLNKWRTIVQARSIESGGPFMCTMALDVGESGQAAAIAYHDGIALEPLYSELGDDGTGGFAVFELRAAAPQGLVDVQQGFSNQRYQEILISLHGKGGADINIAPRGTGVTVTGRLRQRKVKRWQSFDLPVGRTGVLALPLEEIFSPRRLYELRPPEGTFDHHIAVYYSRNAPGDEGRVMSMARLRAIEHRVGVCVLAGTMREAIKTNNYKYIQRFHDTDGVFGLSAKNLGGTRAGCVPGIPTAMIDDYLALS